MENNAIQPQHQSVEVRAPYYVGIAELDELIGLWWRAQSLDEAVDPIMLVSTRSIRGHTIITRTHHTVASWISPTGTCFIWELRTASNEGMMGPDGFSSMDPENERQRSGRSAACTETVRSYFKSHSLFILFNAVVARPKDMVLLEANRPEFLVFNKELNCMEPVDYYDPTEIDG